MARSARKKSNTNKENEPPSTVDLSNTNARCVWTDADDGILIDVLKCEKATGNQSQNGWKKEVWNKVAAALQARGIVKNPPKTATKCQDHFTNVSYCFGTNSFYTNICFL